MANRLEKLYAKISKTSEKAQPSPKHMPVISDIFPTFPINRRGARPLQLEF
jgi:hypothetical protein